MNDYPPKIFLLLENFSKSNNFGPILRCAAAFNVHRVIFIGYQKHSSKGSHGSSKYVTTISYPTYDKVRDAYPYLSYVGIMGVCSGGYDISSLIEVEEVISVKNQESSFMFPHHSQPITNRSFPLGDICFIFNYKHTRGLSKTQILYCDSFIHVPVVDVKCDIQLIDSPTCLSIVLHHYTAWAKYPTRSVIGNKYFVGKKKLHAKEKRKKSTKREKGRGNFGWF